MTEYDERRKQVTSQDSLGRFLAFATPLSVVSASITVGIAHWLSPADNLSWLAWTLWIGFSLAAFLVFVTQNTIESCVILVVLGAVAVIGFRSLPPPILYPAISAVIAPWILTRIHRRYCDNLPWIE